jgi:NAD(P)-dependent dehydrogenase (short-subunit alcohol dehydrogenase family)
MNDTPTALVTGADKGLGQEIARRLGLLGMTVLLGSRDPARGEAAAERPAAGGVPVVPVRLDVTDLNGHQGTRTVEEGARVVVELATLPDDGPSGGFFNDDGPVPW